MHEQSSSFLLAEQILDHPQNAGRDPHERHALSQELRGKSFEELVKLRSKIIRND